MKHTAVEALVRIQFNIPKDEPVTVKYIMFFDEQYHFEVSWYSDEGDFYHQCNLILPHITYSTLNMAG